MMKTRSKVTPEGTRDILFEECRAQREAQSRLSRIFSLRGYQEVVTPGLEYYDVFNLPGAAIPQQEMYKSTDNRGRLLVFRPDSTLPIARMAVSRLQGRPRPLRLYYDQKIYRNRPDLSGRSNECQQMGIELLGASGLRADLEAVSVAAEALSACVPDFRIEVGHARLFQTLADQLPLSPDEKEDLRDVIETKNYGALSGLLDPLGDLPAAQAMRRLPRLFGGEEALKEAERWFTGGESREVLSCLEDFYSALKQLGLGGRLMVDLGLVQPNGYYTGVVFSAYVEDHGDAVLSGGRYDDLCAKFGAPMAAVGFAVDLDAVSRLMAPSVPAAEPPSLLLYGEPGCEVKAQRLAGEYLSRGVSCVCSVADTWEEALMHARAAGIKKAVRIGKQTEETQAEGGDPA